MTGYERAEERSKKRRARNGYKVLDIPCCETCRNLHRGYEGERYCNLLMEPGWQIADVESLGYCDKYGPAEPEGGKPEDRGGGKTQIDDMPRANPGSVHE